jgi:hypothetical protein
MLTDLQSLLAGKKTYLIAGGTIVYMVLGYLLGKSPELDYKTLIELVLAMTIRAGVAKSA